MTSRGFYRALAVALLLVMMPTGARAENGYDLWLRYHPIADAARRLGCASVAFTYNDPVIDVVKRVIGEPGDTIEMVERVVVRNGEPLDEPYVEPNYLPDEPIERFGMAGYQWHLEALAPGVNPQATVMAIAIRNARRFVEEQS